jgi:hypothetical protein
MEEKLERKRISDAGDVANIHIIIKRKDAVLAASQIKN